MDHILVVTSLLIPPLVFHQYPNYGWATFLLCNIAMEIAYLLMINHYDLPIENGDVP